MNYKISKGIKQKQKHTQKKIQEEKGREVFLLLLLNKFIKIKFNLTQWTRHRKFEDAIT